MKDFQRTRYTTSLHPVCGYITFMLSTIFMGGKGILFV